MQDLLLDVKDLKTWFHTEEGTVKAVDGVSFSVNRGETIGIVGESGSGKSVTALSLMQLLPMPPAEIKSGEMRLYVRGVNPLRLDQLSDDKMRELRGKEISMIFQEPMTSLNPVFRCGNQVMEAILEHNDISKAEAKIQTLDMFRRVQLPDPERIFKAYPHQVSGGQKQRVMIAMAMSCNPSLLIADEPTTALDVTVQKSILQLMNELKEGFGTSILFITHDLGVVAEIADRVIVMYKGKIVEQGTVEEIFKQPKHPYTKGLLACRPPLDHRLRRLPVVSDFMETSIDDEGKIQIKERESSIERVIANNRIDSEETINRLKILEAKEPLLKVEALSVWFPKERNFFGGVTSYVRAVDEVSFEVYPGETLGLVGESGCGKTTLGRALLKLIKARSGKVIYKGKSLLEMSGQELKQLRQKVQIIFQDPYSSLNPRMTIGESITEPMRVHKMHVDEQSRRNRTLELLEMVGMKKEHYARYPHEFSGGQRQRICIARALGLEPEFIVCDESVSALDVSVQAQVLNLLMDLRDRFGLSYIFISHDLSVVKFISDRMMVMNKGKIEEIGPADEVYLQPKKRYTQRLIDAIPAISQ